MEMNMFKRVNHHHRAEDCTCKDKVLGHEEEIALRADRIMEKCSVIQHLASKLKAKIDLL